MSLFLVVPSPPEAESFYDVVSHSYGNQGGPVILCPDFGTSKAGVRIELEEIDSSLKEFLESHISELEHGLKALSCKGTEFSTKAELPRSIPGIGPVSVTMRFAKTPELVCMATTEAAAMTGLAPTSHDSGTMHGKRVISGGSISLRQAQVRKRDWPTPIVLPSSVSGCFYHPAGNT